MPVKHYRCALRVTAWPISPAAQIRYVSLIMIQSRPQPAFGQLEVGFTCLYREGSRTLFVPRDYHHYTA